MIANRATENRRGFTIVELLIVIVVIGILAAITIVAFNGVQQRARTAAIQSDLNGNLKKLKLYQAENSSYPTAIDCSATPAASTICLKGGGGNDLTYYGNGQSFCITATNGSTNGYISQSGSPETGTCISNYGVVASWQLNGNLDDSSGTGATLTNNSATPTAGKNGAANGAYAFTRASLQNLSVNSVFGLGINNATLSTWFNSGTATNRGAFLKVGDGNGYGIGVGNSSFENEGSNIIVIYENVRWMSAGAAAITGWHHVALVIDALGVPTVYFDGQPKGSYSGAGPQTPSAKTTIGGYGTVRYFLGAIDDSRIYNRALSAGEIKDIYDQNAQ